MMKRAMALLAVVFVISAAKAGDLSSDDTSLTPAERGYRFLTEKAYLSPDFDQEAFDLVWQQWPEPLRSQAERATVHQRRQMAFRRYGLTPRPGDESGKPLQYVVDECGNWSINCFACHGGQVGGQTVPGLPNSNFALQTLTEEMRATKITLHKPPGNLDLGSLFMPLGNSNGTTNAVMFGVILLAYRDADLNVHPDRPLPKLVHHDLEPPPWWHFKRKHHIYIDGFAEKQPRALMQFMLEKHNGPREFQNWEADYRDVFAYLESLAAPKYPYEISRDLAASGEQVFNENCARCHGTYGPDARYPEKRVPIEVIGTDRVRLDALTPDNRRHYGASWFAHAGQSDTIDDPGGYVAPPLDGIWASAPYFHNGSVPTLWHVLHPSQRPVVWRRTYDGYDRVRIGLEVTTFDKLPSDISNFAELRTYFNTRAFGKSAAGHLFPDELSEPQKQAVLEYLKTL